MTNGSLAPWVDLLVARVPELVEATPDWSPELPYEAFGSFGTFLCSQIQIGGSVDLLRRSFALLNEMAEADDQAVDDLLVTGVLEILGDHEACRKMTESELTGRARDLVRRGILGWSGR